MPTDRRIRTFVLASSITLPVELIRSNPASAHVKPLPIEAAAGEKAFKSYSNLYMSPDGKYVAYTIDAPPPHIQRSVIRDPPLHLPVH